MNTTTGLAHKTDRVTVIVMHHGIILIRKISDFVQLRDDAILRILSIGGF
jgi:hypothetical protein